MKRLAAIAAAVMAGVAPAMPFHAMTPHPTLVVSRADGVFLSAPNSVSTPCWAHKASRLATERNAFQRSGFSSAFGIGRSCAPAGRPASLEREAEGVRSFVPAQTEAFMKVQRGHVEKRNPFRPGYAMTKKYVGMVLAACLVSCVVWADEAANVRLITGLAEEKAYTRSLQLLKPAIALSDRAYLFDNSHKDASLKLEIHTGKTAIPHEPQFPEWITRSLSTLIPLPPDTPCPPTTNH